MNKSRPGEALRPGEGVRPGDTPVSPFEVMELITEELRLDNEERSSGAAAK